MKLNNTKSTNRISRQAHKYKPMVQSDLGNPKTDEDKI